MANEFKVKKGLIVQGSGSVIADVRGSQGQLLSVTDSLTGPLFSVRNVSGLEQFMVSSSGDIRMPNLTMASHSYVITTDPTTGLLYYTASAGIGGGGITDTTGLITTGSDTYPTQSITGSLKLLDRNQSTYFQINVDGSGSMLHNDHIIGALGYQVPPTSSITLLQTLSFPYYNGIFLDYAMYYSANKDTVATRSGTFRAAVSIDTGGPKFTYEDRATNTIARYDGDTGRYVTTENFTITVEPVGGGYFAVIITNDDPDYVAMFGAEYKLIQAKGA